MVSLLSPPPAAASRSTRLVGVIGESVMRRPVASWIALAMAAAVGIVTGSPSPLAPIALASGAGRSIGSETMPAGTSMAVGIL